MNKKAIIIFFSFLLIGGLFVIAEDNSYNWVRAIPRNLFLDSLVVDNLTVTNYFNATVISFNVTGDIAITGNFYANITKSTYANITNGTFQVIKTDQNYNNLTIWAGNLTIYTPDGRYWIRKGHPTDLDKQTGECSNGTYTVFFTSNISKSLARGEWCK